MSDSILTGGCQCGAVRFAAKAPLGRASICHCRMCQKAFGSFFGPLVSTGAEFSWTRGAPRYFQSSNRARRGFCADCGTPLSFEPDDGPPEIAIGAFDDPAALAPTIQHDLPARMPWFEDLAGLPVRAEDEAEAAAGYYASIVSYQRPDHET